jgi:hypothetical protein
MIVKAQPLSDSLGNRMTLMIESAVSIYLYVQLALTDFLGENDLRIEQGWALVIITTITIFINLAVLMKKMIVNSI